MATSSCKSRRIDICSVTGHISRENHEAVFKCMDEAKNLISRTSTAGQSVLHEVSVTGLVVLGLPAFNLKGEPSKNNGTKDFSDKNFSNLVKVPSQLALPINIKSKYFEDIEFVFAHEENSYNMLNAAERSALPIKMKTNAPAEPSASVAFEKYVEKLPYFSQFRSILNCSSSNTQQKILPHFSTFEKNHNKQVIVSVQSPLPIKTEPSSFEDSDFCCAHEKNSFTRLNVSEWKALPIKVKAETHEVAEESIVLEKYEELTNFSEVRSTSSFCSSEANILEKDIQHFSTLKEGTPCKLSNEVHIPEDLPFPCTGNLSISVSDLDKSHSGTNGLNVQHPEKIAVYDCHLTGDDNFPLMEDRGCFNLSPYLPSNFHAGKPQSNPLSSNSLKVKPETVESSQIYSQIPSCNNIRQIFEYKADLPGDLPLDILDFVPLKYRLGNSKLPCDFPPDMLDHIPLKNRMGTSKFPRDFPLGIADNVPLKCSLGSTVSEIGVKAESDNISKEIPPLPSGCRSFGSLNTKSSLSSSRRKMKTTPVTSDCCSFGSVNTKASVSSKRRKKKKTATDSVEKAMDEDAPGLLQVLLDKGIRVEEIKLYGDVEDDDQLEETSFEDSFEELEALMTKLFSEHSSLLKLTSRRSLKRSRAVYCLASLISLIEQCRYLLFRQTPVEWGWCRDLRSFVFVFKTHNRIVLERPEYGYATYFFELVSSLPIDWQMKRLVKAMKLTNCSRIVLLENKPLIVGEDLSVGEAHVLEAYGWTPNTGFGTLLNYCDRVVHDRRNEMHNFDWRAKIGKLLMDGYDGGSLVLTNLPGKVVEYIGSQDPKIKLEP